MTNEIYKWRWELAEIANYGGFPQMIDFSNHWTKIISDSRIITNCPINLWNADIYAILKTLKEDNDVSKLESFIENIKENIKNGKGLTLLGPCGIGKSAICVKILKAVSEKTISFFIDSNELINNIIKRAWKEPQAEKFLRRISECDLIIFDDFAKVDEMKYIWDFFYNRYNDNKSSFFTANIEEKYIMEEHNHVYSRMKDKNLVIDLIGADYRQSNE